MAKDLGTILVGEQAVKAGLADQVGGIAEALSWLHDAISEKKVNKNCYFHKNAPFFLYHLWYYL